MAVSRAQSKLGEVMGMLTLPHQILSWMEATSSRYLSLGLRPVRSPVRQTRAPLEANLPSPAAMARSTSSAEEALVRVRLGERSRRERGEAAEGLVMVGLI